jgi:membrane-bound metal-dependent hydrolase YbcI (DUF457 family)
VDIITHAVMGAIVAAPFMESHPVEAVCFSLGAVLPDIDALSRLFGKWAFMKFHQSYTHALPVIALLGLLSWPALRAIDAPALAALTLALGMVFHSLLDVTNTYGIALFLPFSRRRFSTEWVFFIDSVVIAISYPALILINQYKEMSTTIAAFWGLLMLLYWLLKMSLRRRALQLSPDGTQALLPSALLPWEFLGCWRQGESVRLFHINALTGSQRKEEIVPIFDAAHRAALDHVAEFKVMTELSAAYHVVEEEGLECGVKLYCRDLRTRNFKTRFGELELTLDSHGQARELLFHV